MEREHRITIVEIAKKCGVSKTTVGDALNSEKAYRVSKSKCELIGSVAKRLGYIPNHSAKVMRTRNTHIIGVMLPNPNNSFHGNIVLELQKRLAERGYTAFFVFWDDFDAVDSVNKALSTLLTHGVEGIISSVLPGVHFRSSQAPLVFWQNAPDGFDSVCNLDGVSSAYRRLIAMLKNKGCARFALFTPVFDQGRAPVILEALHEIGLSPPLPQHLLKISSSTAAKSAMAELLSLSVSRPDVVLCNNDAIALGAMGEALRNGIRVPEDMRFVGFDGTDEAEISYPSLTTFKVPVKEVAEKLVERLFKRMADRKAPPVKVPIEP
ncbi:MAG: LacI family DNA-binding transcriptional regulator, partial [Victivallales bacterium]|nr:LacI family DNA-binding transcriptional regulator [Victivallales bacterium]